MTAPCNSTSNANSNDAAAAARAASPASTPSAPGSQRASPVSATGAEPPRVSSPARPENARASDAQTRESPAQSPQAPPSSTSTDTTERLRKTVERLPVSSDGTVQAATTTDDANPRHARPSWDGPSAARYSPLFKNASADAATFGLTAAAPARASPPPQMLARPDWGPPADQPPTQTSSAAGGATPVAPAVVGGNDPPHAVVAEEVAAGPDSKPRNLEARIFNAYAEAVSHPQRSAALNGVPAPPFCGPWSDMHADREFESFKYAHELPGVIAHWHLRDRVTAASPELAAGLGYHWCPPARRPSAAAAGAGAGQHHPHGHHHHLRADDAADVASTVVVGQIPYAFDGGCVGRLLAELAALRLGLSAAETAAAVEAVRPHERAKKPGMPPHQQQQQQQSQQGGGPTRRCGLWFVEIDPRRQDVLHALLSLHRCALVSDQSVVVCAESGGFTAWTAARDSFAQYVMRRVPEVRRDAHSKFQKGLGAVTIEAHDGPPPRRHQHPHHTAATYADHRGRRGSAALHQQQQHHGMGAPPIPAGASWGDQRTGFTVTGGDASASRRSASGAAFDLYPTPTPANSPGGFAAPGRPTSPGPAWMAAPLYHNAFAPLDGPQQHRQATPGSWSVSSFGGAQQQPQQQPLWGQPAGNASQHQQLQGPRYDLVYANGWTPPSEFQGGQ